MTDHDAPRPTTPLDEIYAALLRDQPDNEVLWERIIARAKAEPETGSKTPESPAMVQQRKDHQKRRAIHAGLFIEKSSQDEEDSAWRG